ncbi:MAG: hypothetical protein ACLTV6_10780 [Christensenellales bacterium]
MPVRRRAQARAGDGGMPVCGAQYGAGQAPCATAKVVADGASLTRARRIC